VSVLPGWSPDLERSFKEVLYRMLEEVQSTKAALYLLAPEGVYLLMSQYGFGRRDLLASEFHVRDPLVLKVRQHHDRPTAVNAKEDFPEIASYLEGAGTARLLLVPLSAGSQVVGFVDARDKGRRRPFEPGDVRRARDIAAALLQLIRQAGLYPELEPEPEPETVGALPELVRMVEPGPRIGRATGEALLDEAGLASIQGAAGQLLHREGVISVALALVSGERAGGLLLGRRGIEGLDRNVILRHQSDALRQAGVLPPEPLAWLFEGQQVPWAKEPTGPQLIVSAVLLRSGRWAVVGSVVGMMGSSSAQEAVGQLARVAADAQQATKVRFSRRMLVQRLLRPGEREYPELEAHSMAVSRLTWLLAQRLGLGEAAAEEAALAGLMHDVGMRELDYAAIYRHPSPGSEERRLYQQHPLLGERIVAGAGLAGLPTAIRHHHERWDGQGYPDQLRGEDIPLVSRLVHVAEVFDVLTSPTSYRSPVGMARAITIMRTSTGHQFDSQVVELLAQVVA